MDLVERDIEVDLEHGVTTSKDYRQVKKTLGRAHSGPSNFNGFMKFEDEINLCNGLGVVETDVIELLIDENLEGQEGRDWVGPMEKKPMKEKCKTVESKKPPRPPRPPQALSLNAADQKLVREISELAMKKRARIERIKALKKKRANKSPSSSNGSLFPMLVTIIFCLVIIFQGSLGSRALP